MTRVAKLVAAGLALVAALSGIAFAEETAGGQDLDTRVRQFLDSHRDQWRDMTVPAVDGRLLHDLILENGYTRALEIGTSTGRSAEACRRARRGSDELEDSVVLDYDASLLDGGDLEAGSWERINDAISDDWEPAQDTG